MLKVGTEEEKKARQKARRWGARLVSSFIDHSSRSCPFPVIFLNVCAEVDGQPHALRCLQSESHQMITSQPTGSVLRKHGMPSLTALIWTDALRRYPTMPRLRRRAFWSVDALPTPGSKPNKASECRDASISPQTWAASQPQVG